ncbi:Histone-lysine N-methyltransferase EHMT1 [Fragariocoptes setiger]|uniref:Histone-lysine N-methyltransferase EHMT1 n=1 Tax=Fragariocoptes setiger TaxID=1670756 RepID=A0ABQ7SAS1_9ACAR|nr:Histone-lysine N-methyltransferase EHMT1 [Fragariocoptes setiger]
MIASLISWFNSEYLVNEDITNGYERNRIPAVSYRRSDRAPDDFNYVPCDVELEPLAVDRSLASLKMCECQDNCSADCKCTEPHQSKAYYSKGRLAPTYNLEAPEVIYECNVACKCSAKCENRVIQRGSNLKLVLFRTRSRGWGIRTRKTIKKGTFIGVYSGELITTEESYKRKDDTYLFNLTFNTSSNNSNEQQYVNDARYFGNFTRFINHSCAPNVIGIRSFTTHQDVRFPHIAFFALEKIEAQSELTLNYGDNYWLVKCKRDRAYCLCKQDKCRFTKKTFPITLKEALERRKAEARAKRDAQKKANETPINEGEQKQLSGFCENSYAHGECELQEGEDENVSAASKDELIETSEAESQELKVEII